MSIVYFHTYVAHRPMVYMRYAEGMNEHLHILTFRLPEYHICSENMTPTPHRNKCEIASLMFKNGQL